VESVLSTNSYEVSQTGEEPRTETTGKKERGAGLVKTETLKNARKDISIQCDVTNSPGKQEDSCPWETDFELEA